MAAITSVAGAPAISLTRPNAGTAAVRSEWTKFRTLRSTWLTMVLCVASGVALAALASASDASAWADMDAAERAAYDPTSTTLVGVLFGALVLGALGVRSTAGEYATGMIRTTAAAIPRRVAVVGAKAAVIAVAAVVVSFVANLAAFSVGSRILQTESIDVVFDGDSTLAIGAGAVAVAAFAVMGVGLGAIVRRASVANILLALVVVGGQLVGSALPASARRFLPSSALQATVTAERADDLLAPVTASVALVATASAVLAIATLLVQRRDV
jgi:ABC-2 type transport system permease protein